MCNNWLTIGPLTIHGYGFMIAVGILVSLTITERKAKSRGLSETIVDNMLWLGLLFGFLGAKLLYLIVNWQDFIQDPLHFIGSSGWVVYGGLICGTLAAWLYTKSKGADFLTYFNMIAPQISLSQAFGRIGCFFAGCCYGKITHSRFGVVFPAGSLAPAGVSLIPTQLISAFGNFVFFLILHNIEKDEKYRRMTGGLYIVLYSIGRFMIEFLRGDAERGAVGILSTSQFIAVLTLLFGLFIVLRTRKREGTE